jgi:hypothetical protein
VRLDSSSALSWSTIGRATRKTKLGISADSVTRGTIRALVAERRRDLCQAVPHPRNQQLVFGVEDARHRSLTTQGRPCAGGSLASGIAQLDAELIRHLKQRVAFVPRQHERKSYYSLQKSDATHFV